MAYNIFIFDPTEYHVWLSGQELGKGVTKTVKKWASSEKAELCFNLGYFTFKTGLSDTYVKGPKGVHSYGGWSDIVKFGVNECKGYSNAISGGIVNIQYPRRDVRTRNGIGTTLSGKVIIAQSSSKVSEVAFANAVNSFAKRRGETVKIFVLQDGGGSTSEYSSVSNYTFAPEGLREVATVACVRRLKKVIINRTLSCGKTGNDVRSLQIILGGRQADSIFGSDTRAGVKAAQRYLGLASDGIAGPLTLKALGFR